MLAMVVTRSNLRWLSSSATYGGGVSPQPLALHLYTWRFTPLHLAGGVFLPATHLRTDTELALGQLALCGGIIYIYIFGDIMGTYWILEGCVIWQNSGFECMPKCSSVTHTFYLYSHTVKYACKSVPIATQFIVYDVLHHKYIAQWHKFIHRPLLQCYRPYIYRPILIHAVENSPCISNQFAYTLQIAADALCSLRGPSIPNCPATSHPPCFPCMSVTTCQRPLHSVFFCDILQNTISGLTRNNRQ